MLTKRNAMLATVAAVLVAVAGDRAASAGNLNYVGGYFDGDLPFDAIQGGYDTDGATLYFCVGGTVTPQPGKVNQNLGSCRWPYGGAEQVSEEYGVLVPHWESASGGRPAGSPYRAGTDSDLTPLYFCRASYLGGLQPGKLRPGAGCYIAYGGNEILLNNYDVLQDDMPMTLNGDDMKNIIGGYEADHSPLYLCVAHQVPGKVVADGLCHFSYGGEEFSTQDYSRLDLRTTNLARTPAFDFVVGLDNPLTQPLYACTAYIAADRYNSQQLGKYRQDFSDCHVAWGGNEWVSDAIGDVVD